VIPVTCLVDLAEINVTADVIPGYVLNMGGIGESNVDMLLIKHNSTPQKGLKAYNTIQSNTVQYSTMSLVCH